MLMSTLELCTVAFITDQIFIILSERPRSMIMHFGFAISFSLSSFAIGTFTPCKTQNFPEIFHHKIRI